jgi:hypothetical protein
MTVGDILFGYFVGLIAPALTGLIACIAFVRVVRRFDFGLGLALAFCVPVLLWIILKFPPYFASGATARSSYYVAYNFGPLVMLLPALALWRLSSLLERRATDTSVRPTV